MDHFLYVQKKSNYFFANGYYNRTTEKVHTSNEMMPLIISETMNQFDRTHFLNDSIDSSDSNSRRSVARGPAGSTSRHFWKTSQ